MTNPRPNTCAGLTDTLQAAGRHLGETFAEMTFSLTAAQGTLGALLRGEPGDQVRNRLNRLTTDQLERIDRSARELILIVDGLLEDREVAAEQSKEDEPTLFDDAETTETTTGRPDSVREFGEGVS